MKRENLVLEVYWKKRKETLRKCTQDFLSFLKKIRSYQPIFFGTWYGTGRSQKEYLNNKIVLEYECIKKQLSKKNKENSFPEFAYQGFVGNEKEDFEFMYITFSLGGINSQYLNIVNNCMINLPEEGEIYDYFEKPSHQLELTKLMIKHWNPDYISIHDYTKKILPPFTDEKLLQAIKNNVVYYP